MAVPFAVAYATVTFCAAAADSVTVNDAGVVPALPSVTLASAIESVGSGAPARS